MRRIKQGAALVVAGIAVAIGVTQIPASGGGAPSLPEGLVAAPASARDIGGGVTESKFVPVTPCRLYDSRKIGGGAPFAVQATRPLKIRQPEDFAGQFNGQGGLPGGCGIPAQATSVEVTITAVSAAGSGFLRAWAGNQTEPNATFLNFIKELNPSNTGTIAICNSGCAPAADMRIRVYGNRTQVVVDVQGYTIKPMAAAVNSAGTLTSGSRVVSTSRPFQGQYLVKFDRAVNTCVPSATVEGTTGNAYAMFGYDSADATRIYVFTSDANGSLQNRGFALVLTC